MKKFSSIIIAIALIATCFTSCTVEQEKNLNDTFPNAHEIVLNSNIATINGSEISEFDYTWHCDPSISHDEVENAPAEYYTGTKPQTDAAVYIDRELYYYPLLDESGFTLQNYDGEKEWTYYYNDGKHNEYIFATLPALGNTLPVQMMHSEDEAAKNKVLHITKAGEYILSGSWDGQVLIDLGDEDENFTDSQSKVTLILNGADINCTVAPGIIFRDIYECDNAWEEREDHSTDIDTTNAGANVILVDGTTNNISGKNIYRMLKTKYKEEDSADAVKVQKKLRKTDAAFYSYVSMNISGKGSLNITSNYEGLDSELHLTINNGNITINSQDDGINVNEDNVSVVTINGGNITLNAAQGVEGDGIDSNGFVVLNGGTLNINGITPPDSAIDSEDGIHYNGGTVIIDNQTQTYTAGSVFNETGKGGFGEIDRDTVFGEKPHIYANEDFNIKEFKEKVAELDDNATLQDVLEILGMNMNRGDRPNNNTDIPANDKTPPSYPGNDENPPENMQQPPEIPQN